MCCLPVLCVQRPEPFSVFKWPLRVEVTHVSHAEQALFTSLCSVVCVAGLLKRREKN